MPSRLYPGGHELRHVQTLKYFIQPLVEGVKRLDYLSPFAGVIRGLAKGGHAQVMLFSARYSGTVRKTLIMSGWEIPAASWAFQAANPPGSGARCMYFS